MPDAIRIGTRASQLALWQTEHVVARIEAAHPGSIFERVTIRTLGDRIADVPLARIGDKGLFTREIEDGLREESIDLAVHSLKDLPTHAPDGLIIGAVLQREDPREALVTRTGVALDALPAGARVGTSSLRRRSQLLARRADLVIADIRGNVPTRLEKVARGDYDATLLAAAGLRRLALTARITQTFAPEEFLPAPGQGALAVQCRAGDARLIELLRSIDDLRSRFATTAERAVLSAIEGGCQAPLGTLAEWETDATLHVRGIVVSVDGRLILRAESRGPAPDEPSAVALGQAVASELLARGAAHILDETRATFAAEAPRPELGS